MCVVSVWIFMCLLCIILPLLLISAYSTFPHLLLKVNTCVCSALPLCNCLHILIISRWSNYSAACITLFMWHTISRQLTWASKCQPIGCAITPLSDISIIAAVPCITLRQQGADSLCFCLCVTVLPGERHQCKILPRSPPSFYSRRLFSGHRSAHPLIFCLS